MSDELKTTLPAKPDLDRQLIAEIAMDIGKEVAAHIETMYPAAVEATGSTFLLSVRNTVHNEIMAALETIDESDIRRRLAARKQFRRKHRAAYRKIRGKAITEEVIQDE
jgi:hypothetical protein